MLVFLAILDLHTTCSALRRQLQNFLDVPDDVGDIRMQCAQSKKRSVLPGVYVLKLDMNGVVCAAGTAEIGEVVVWATPAEFLL